MHYPVAHDAYQALDLLRREEGPRAPREREASDAVRARVAFVTQPVGPIYETREEAATQAGALLDNTPVCTLVCRARDFIPRKSKPIQPVFTDGARWPKAQKPTETVWQLSVSYWKIITDVQPTTASVTTKHQARHVRKKTLGEDLTPDEIRALSQTPLLAVRPQKALDFGLFDFPLPEDPGRIIADE